MRTKSGRVHQICPGVLALMVIVALVAFQTELACTASERAASPTLAQLEIQLGHATMVVSAAFSPNGRLVVTGGDMTARLWETATGHELRCLTGHSEEVRSVAFSSDGRYVLTGSDDKTSRLWET